MSLVAHARLARSRLAATLIALLLGACGGSSVSKTGDEDGPDGEECSRDSDCPQGRLCADVNGNRNEVCESGETCECALPEPGNGGRPGRGGSGGGGSSATGGSAGVPGCEQDRDCPNGQFCADINGDLDGFCEADETCECISVGAGGAGTGGTSSGGAPPMGGSGSGGMPTGGSAGRGGGGSGGAVTTGLGAPCRGNADCSAELTCVTSGGLADGSGPPNGLCTLPCTSDDLCLEYASAAYCVGFTATESYCIEACLGGAANAPKCHLRADFACSILATSPTTRSCITTSDCPAAEVCVDGLCEDMLTACRPTCGGDFDCASGQFCDFATGFCVPAAPGGLPLGAICDPTLPAESDLCNGFCVATDDANTEGTCSAFCSANASLVGCGWNGTETAEAGCLFATVVSRDSSGGISLAESDLMLCGKLCDCNEDCPAEAELCFDENSGDPTASIRALFDRAGYCRAPFETETEIDSIECP